jgi:gentisate 1,2-dioxygenase
MALHAPDRVRDVEAYRAELRASGLDAPWMEPGPLIRPKASAVQARLWRWIEIEPLVRKSAEFMRPGRGAERRILRLDNPGVPERTSTHTISTAVQFILPGEVAPAHRHTPSAVRFMLHGHGAYTTVEGDKCVMEPGDLVLTPSMTWHDHGNEGTEPAMWIDGLDSPVVRYLENLAMDPYPEERQPVAAVSGVSERRYGGPGLRPVTGESEARPGRLLHYRWEATRTALLRQQELPANPYDDVMLEYVNPSTGRSVLPTLGCYVQMLRPGIRTRSHRETSSAVYHVVAGAGHSLIDGARFDWTRGDFFAVPPRARHEHACDGADPAILFSFQDVPLLTALGFYRMEA